MSERRARYRVAATPDEGRALLWRLMPEEELLQRVRGWLRLHGWQSWHQRDSRRSDEGWPDLMAMRTAEPGRRERRVALIECKRERGVLRPRQVETLQVWAALGDPVECYVVRPSSWPDVRAALAMGGVPDRGWWLRRLMAEIEAAETTKGETKRCEPR